ncbi:hypothetical protein G8A07_06990 [Roseateles sp. DAIF2]|uniref:hypothetical protein n=1 Tax=Roseateles sp. DAIF2 TaxID=2714952 RepID=UPI0018A2C07C|nr:hypothetical protein [Roseateles sp. DAIF2]QPF72698.1 hypothetical protein G8A07_06990 [Roseateles sp. DAIF2]
MTCDVSMEAAPKKSAEDSFRQAFERLKSDEPVVMPKGAPVTQNNVAREAGKRPRDFRKDRFPKLIREIQAYIEIHEGADVREKQEQKSTRRTERLSLKESNALLKVQRDEAQSRLAGAHRQILKLIQEKLQLQRRLDGNTPPPTHLP